MNTSVKKSAPAKKTPAAPKSSAKATSKAAPKAVSKAAGKAVALKAPATTPAVKTPAKTPAVRTDKREAMLARVEAVRLQQRAEGNFDCFGRAGEGYCDQGGCLYHAECLSVSRMLHSL